MKKAGKRLENSNRLIVNGILKIIFYEGQSKITEPYLITFQFGIVGNKCDYFL